MELGLITCGKSEFCQRARRIQVEVGREKQGEGETQGKGQSEEQRSNKPSTAHHGWYEDDMTHSCIHLSHGSS